MSDKNTSPATPSTIVEHGHKHHEPRSNQRTKAQIVRQQSRHHGGGFGGGHVGTGEKALNFWPSLKRLIALLMPQKVMVVLVLLVGAIGVVGNVINPKLMVHPMNEIFAGFMSDQVTKAVTAPGSGVTVAQLQSMSAGQFLQQMQQMASTPGADSRITSALKVIQGMETYFRPGYGINFTSIGHWLLLIAGIYLVASILTFLQSFMITKMTQRAVFHLREQVSHKLDRLPLKYFDSQPRGELLSRVTNDMDNIQQSLQQSVASLVNSVLTLIGAAIMIFTVSWLLGLITLIIVPLSATITMTIAKRAQKRFIRMWEATGELNSQVEETDTGHSLVKVFGHRAEADATFKKTNDDLFHAAFGAQFLSGTLMPINMFVGNLIYVVIAIVGCLRAVAGALTLGAVTSSITYARMFTQPISQIASQLNTLQSGVASAERVFEVLDADEQTPDGDAPLPEPVHGAVTFEDVAFSYDPERPLITDLSMNVKPGQTIAIVGETGAGKTTLVNLLMRFYDIQGGRITFDGVDTATVARGALRSEFGMVLQDTWLFHGTIRDNIAYGKIGATDEEVHAAAKASYADRFVHALPEGYDTEIDDEGSNVSAGEKQLLTIARAFIADPAVLILDEATSSVDTRTEVLVQQAMAALRQGRTSFVIAHRLSTIRDADIILVMDHGSIVEQGNHEDLLAAGGAYAQLYRAQFAAGKEDEEQLEAAAPAKRRGGMAGMFG